MRPNAPWRRYVREQLEGCDGVSDVEAVTLARKITDEMPMHLGFASAYAAVYQELISTLKRSGHLAVKVAGKAARYVQIEMMSYQEFLENLRADIARRNGCDASMVRKAERFKDSHPEIDFSISEMISQAEELL